MVHVYWPRAWEGSASTVVGGHVGAPWIDEVILLADKCPNFFVDTSAYRAAAAPCPIRRVHARAWA